MWSFLIVYLKSVAIETGKWDGDPVVQEYSYYNHSPAAVLQSGMATITACQYFLH